MGEARVPKRIAAVIINSLKGGVVPRIGLRLSVSSVTDVVPVPAAFPICGTATADAAARAAFFMNVLLSVIAMTFMNCKCCEICFGGCVKTFLTQK